MLSELNSQYQGNDIMYFNEIRFLEWILNEGVIPEQAESASRSREKNTKKLNYLQYTLFTEADTIKIYFRIMTF